MRSHEKRDPWLQDSTWDETFAWEMFGANALLGGMPRHPLIEQTILSLQPLEPSHLAQAKNRAFATGL